MKDNVYQRLLTVQKEAHAPRDVQGRFGKARSAEQILEAYKPVCNKHGLFLHTSDVIEQVGDRNYITTTATVVNVDTPTEQVHASASAWENQVSAGLDTSQVSGKTSSYAKKYALQNLFAIDDTKDADQVHEDPVDGKAPATDLQKIMIKNLLKNKGIETKEDLVAWVADNYGDASKLSIDDAHIIIDDITKELNTRA